MRYKHKFYVGQKVRRITKDSWIADLKVGEIVTVEKINAEGTISTEEYLDKNFITVYFIPVYEDSFIELWNQESEKVVPD